MLEFKSVRKRFEKNEVLKELTFRLDAGEILGLLAPNGGGKTTAMRIAMGLIPFDDGAVTVFDKPVKPGAVRGVGYMPEERGLYPNERVEDQLRYFARLSKMSPTAIDRRMVELLDELNVLRYKNKKVKELSLGNKQRVQIAAALIGKPQLVLLQLGAGAKKAPFLLCDQRYVPVLSGRRVSDCLCAEAWFTSSPRIGRGMPQLVG